MRATGHAANNQTERSRAIPRDPTSSTPSGKAAHASHACDRCRAMRSKCYIDGRRQPGIGAAISTEVRVGCITHDL